MGTLQAGEVVVLGVEAIDESLAFVDDWIKSRETPVWSRSP